MSKTNRKIKLTMDEYEQIPEQADQISQQVSNIIGSPTSLTRKRTSEGDKQREKFEKIIRILEEVNTRSMIMNMDLGLDVNKYNEKFYEVIDTLISMHFNKDCARLIFFYIYDRLNSDGSINELIDDRGNTVILETPTDLWMVIQSINKYLNGNKKNKTT